MSKSILKTIGVILLQITFIYVAPILPEFHTHEIYTITFAMIGTSFLSFGVGYLSNFKPRKYYYPLLVLLVLIPAFIFNYVYSTKQLIALLLCSLSTYAGTLIKVNDFITSIQRKDIETDE